MNTELIDKLVKKSLRSQYAIATADKKVVVFYGDELEKFVRLIVKQCSELSADPQSSYEILKHFGIVK